MGVIWSVLTLLKGEREGEREREKEREREEMRKGESCVSEL